MHAIHTSRGAPLAAAAGAALLLALLPAAGAAAATDDSGTGWIRVAHLSPDTKAVDVTMTAVAGSEHDVELDGLAYGAVTKYVTVPDGTYILSMRPAGSAASAPAVVRTTVDVADDSASTVAVFGRNDDLHPQVVADDLTPPASGSARVRLVQASTRAAPVSVTSSDGTTVAERAEAGSVSGYASVPLGRWRLTTVQGTSERRSTVSLAGGQVVSLFVLDDAAGGTVVRSVVDAAGTNRTPKGYLATGGGYLAHGGEDRGPIAAVSAALLALVAGAAAVISRRRARRA